MKKITFFILALSFTISSLAQISISGTVSNDSIPLESANVIIKNSTNGIATNSKGQFKIEAKKGDTLSISYLGYESKELVVDKNNHLEIKLEEDINLDEVLIIGYDNSSHYCRTSCGVCISYEIYWNNEVKKNKLFPNPSLNGIFQLKLTEAYDDVKISIATISGQTIQNTTHQKFGEKLTIDLSQYPTGIYIINIIADGNYLEAIKALRR